MKYILVLLMLLTACRQEPVETETETEVQTEQSEEITESEETEEITETEETEYTGAYCPLSGLPIEGENDSRVYGVMIDNQVDARPQSGISKSPIVYEYEVESEITRYLAIFAKEEVEKIGPIRSLRPYFIDTLMEYDAMVVRFGGSTQADSEVYEYGIDEINGMSNGVNIWRDNSTGKVAPHNAYSSSESILQGMENMGYQTGKTEGVFNFKKEKLPLENKAADAREVYLTFNPYEKTSFSYDPDQENYIRKINDEVQVDEYYKDEIRRDNILVLYMDVGYMENGIHRWVADVGEGEGLYISMGGYEPISWSKESRGAKMELFDANGDPLKLNPGKTWVEIISPDKGCFVE